MLLLGLRNTSEQVVPVGGNVNFGTVYHRYCKKYNGVKTFDSNGLGVSLQQSGIYQITITATFTTPTAGDVTLEIYENGLPTGVLATETITTADTESRSIALDYFALVNSGCVLGNLTTLAELITLVNTSDVVATITNVVFNVVKVV